MKRLKRGIGWILGALFVTLVMAIPFSPLLLLEKIEARQAQAVNLLANGGFESGFRNYNGVGELSIANDWYPWYSEGNGIHRPEFKPETRDVGAARVYEGAYAQKQFTTYSMQDGGVYQQVPTIPDEWYTFDCWVYVWSSSGDDPNVSTRPWGKLAALVGINPWGDARATYRTTIWGKEVVDAYDQWLHVSVTAQAWSDHITVFTRAQADYAVKHNDSYWDGCTLRQADMGTQPCPTATPCPTVTPGAGGECPSAAEIRDIVSDELGKLKLGVVP